MKKNSSEKLPRVQKNVLLKNFTTYKIGGPAKYFFIAKTKEDLVEALRVAKNLKLPVFILGGGSNVLVSEKGFKGLVIRMSNNRIELKDGIIYTDAGTKLAKLVSFAANNNFTGFEWATGIPGATVGGCIFGNAQAFGVKISDDVKFVEALDSNNLSIKTFTKEQCRFSLKNSIFKENKNLVIISVAFETKKDLEDKIKEKTKEFVRHRKVNHPMNFPSAGSVFVNPEEQNETLFKNKELLKKFPELNEYNKKGIASAGYLILKSGLSGKRAGNAQISEKHSNFIINLGGAKSGDVLKLIKLAKKEVQKNFGIELEPEVQLVGF